MLKISPKRVNFIGIQNRHVVPCESYSQPALRTGYEQVIPYRTGSLFAVMAKKKGKVVTCTPTGIVVEYEDGERIGAKLGRIYGNASGLTIPHFVKSPLKEGDVFEVGDPIAYNTGFFEPDFLNPRYIVWKSTTLVRTVLLESPDTLEDSSAISSRIAGRLSTKATKVRDVFVNFGQALHSVVEEGQLVEAEDILLIIEDELSARSQMLDAESVSSLRNLQADAQEAKVRGIVERIEVFYNGDFEDMSDSLRKLVKKSDKSMNKRSESSGEGPSSGLTPLDFRIGADPLLLDQACIRFYITSDVGMGVGDKAVFCNQMKTVVGRVFSDDIETESGVKIDAVFGARSLGDRIVPSPYIQGTTLVLQEEMSKRFARAYRS